MSSCRGVSTLKEILQIKQRGSLWYLFLADKTVMFTRSMISPSSVEENNTFVFKVA